MTKGLCHMGFPDNGGTVEDDRFASVEPAQRGQVVGGDFDAPSLLVTLVIDGRRRFTCFRSRQV